MLRPQRPALRLDPRRARAGREDVAAERIVRRRPGACQAERLSCIALARLDEIAADTPALLARNRALANAFFAGRERARDGADGAAASPLSRACCAATSTRSTRCCASEYDTAIVPGRFFGLADHFRIGIGGADRDRRGRARTARRGAGRAAHEEGRHRRILPPARRPHSRIPRPSSSRSTTIPCWSRSSSPPRRPTPASTSPRSDLFAQGDDARADARARRGGAEAAHQDDRPVQHEGEERHRPLPRAGRAAWRQGPRRPRRAPGAARRRPQDRQCGDERRLRRRDLRRSTPTSSASPTAPASRRARRSRRSRRSSSGRRRRPTGAPPTIC